MPFFNFLLNVLLAYGSAFRPHPSGHDYPPAISHHSTMQQNKPFQNIAQFNLQ
jgi:hypothetical protein